MSRYTHDKNLIEIFTDGIRGGATGTPSSAPSSPAANWLGLGILGLAALSIFGIVMGRSEQETTAETSGSSSAMGFGMVLGTLAIAAAAIAGMSRPATARPRPAPAP